MNAIAFPRGMPSRLARTAILAGLILPASLALCQSRALAQTQPPAAPAVAAPAQPGAAISAEWRQILEQTGTFSKHERYGEVWQPANVAQDWQPYPACLWTYKQNTAWYLDDPSDWGKIVHHYGRWTQDGEKGWLWIAGTEFSPAWVVWDNAPSKVGWAPKLPDIDEKEIDLEDYKKSGAFQHVDSVKFGQGCNNPPPRVSMAPPPPRFAPIRSVAPMPAPQHGGGYVGGGFVDSGWVGGHICKFKPWLPKCKPAGGFCLKHPFHPKCKIGKLPPSCSKGIKPAWCSPVCKTKPWMPMCKAGWGKKPLLAKKTLPGKFKPGHFRPHRPIVKKFRPHIRPHLARPYRPIARSQQFRQQRFATGQRNFRPRQNFRVNRGVGQRPVLRQRVSNNNRLRRF